MRRSVWAFVGAVLLVGSVLVSPASAAGLPMTLIKDGFSEPVFLANAGDARLFVVEQGGLIKIIEPDSAVKTFLDVSGLVLHDKERGLFSVAFDPKYAKNGLFYIEYTRASDGATTVSEYRRSASDADAADPASGRVVIVVTQPNAGHNGGWLGFQGKYLYVTVGDGDSPSDALGYGQNTNVLNGKILRINPHDPDGSGPKSYSVPAGNPFVGRAGADEIWSWGVRNTWRCSFDRGTGKLWCGDVGAGLYEEIDRITTDKGVNFGWSLVEGSHYFNVPGKVYGSPCTSKCKTLPIAEYSHDSNGPPCSAVTGGYVARHKGAALYGKYVFGDYCTGNIWEIPANFVAGRTLPSPIANIGAYKLVSFGEDKAGHIYLVDHTGSIFRLDQS